MTVNDAIRLIARSQNGAQLLGKVLAGRFTQPRYNQAARAVLSDPEMSYTPAERELILSFIQGAEVEYEIRSENYQIRLTPSEKKRLEELAGQAGVTVAEYIRSKLAL